MEMFATQPLRWTCKSIQKLSDELETQGYKINSRSVCNLLADLGYSLQSKS